MWICKLTSVALVLALWPRLCAEESWQIPHNQDVITFAFPALIDIDRSATIMVLPTARDMVATEVVGHGMPVQRGEVIIAFDTARHQREVIQHQHELTIAQAEARVRELRLESDRQVIADERQALQGDLAVAEAALAQASQRDPDQVALLIAERDRATIERTRLQRLALRAERALAAGEVTGDDAVRRQQELIAGEEALRLAQAELDAFINEDVSLLRERRRLRVDDLRVRLGIDAEGRPVSGAGITGRIEALEAQQRRDRRQLIERRERAERELHESIRDAWDHVPLLRLVAGDRQLRFAAEEFTAAGNETLVTDTAYTAERGYGFTTVQGSLTPVLRQGRRGASTACVVVRGQAQFRVDLPAGEHDVTLELGDDRDWDGVVVHLVDADGRRPFAVERRIEANRPVTVRARIRLDGGPLVMQYGDQHHKALRAPATGIALPREWIAPGWKPGWTQDPAAFIAGPGSVRLRAILHQDLARLLRTEAVDGGDKPAADVDLAERVATASATWRAPTGMTGTATVANVVRLAVPLSLRADAIDDGPLDRLGNEVILAVADAFDPARLRPGGTVEVTVAIAVPAGCTVVPAHVVGRLGEQWYVQVAGDEPRSCQAVRVNGHYLVDVELAPGTTLVPVDLDVAAATETRFTGEVVAGASSPVQSITASGRIAEMLPDGSRVRAGERVVALYSPWIEDRREDNARRREQALQAYEEAGETRRVAAERAAVEHRGQVVAERLARIDAELARETDPLTVEQAHVALERARSEDALARAILARAEELGEPQRLESAQRGAARAAIDVQRTELTLVAARQASNWLASREAELLWRDAVTDLGGREQDLNQARIQEKAASLRAELDLAQALQGSRWERQFEEGKDLLSPVDGRLFYRKGWDDRTHRRATFQRDFWVWRGMTVADVLDTANLAFEVDVPESRVLDLKVGAPVSIILTRFDHRTLQGQVESVGRAVMPARDDDPTGEEHRIGLRRVVRVRCTFTVPEELRDRLIPGTKGELELP